jgi:hypothetical protein
MLRYLGAEKGSTPERHHQANVTLLIRRPGRLPIHEFGRLCPYLIMKFLWMLFSLGIRTDFCSFFVQLYRSPEHDFMHLYSVSFSLYIYILIVVSILLFLPCLFGVLCLWVL